MSFLFRAGVIQTELRNCEGNLLRFQQSESCAVVLMHLPFLSIGRSAFVSVQCVYVSVGFSIEILVRYLRMVTSKSCYILVQSFSEIFTSVVFVMCVVEEMVSSVRTSVWSVRRKIFVVYRLKVVLCCVCDHPVSIKFVCDKKSRSTKRSKISTVNFQLV